jgi:hypothetical protein
MFIAIPPSACTSLLAGNTGPGRDSRLVYADVASPSAGAFIAPNTPTDNTFPISPATAAALCGDGATSDVAFTFKLKG